MASGTAGRVVFLVAGVRGSHARSVTARMRGGIAAVGLGKRNQRVPPGQTRRRLGQDGGELADGQHGDVPPDRVQAVHVLVQAGQ